VGLAHFRGQDASGKQEEYDRIALHRQAVDSRVCQAGENMDGTLARKTVLKYV